MCSRRFRCDQIDFHKQPLLTKPIAVQRGNRAATYEKTGDPCGAMMIGVVLGQSQVTAVTQELTLLLTWLPRQGGLTGG